MLFNIVRTVGVFLWGSLFLLGGLLFSVRGEEPDEKRCPVHVRLHNFTANPSTGPVAEVTVTNLTDQAVSGELSVRFPENWTVTVTKQEFELAGKERKLLSFAIKKALDLASNRYPVTLSLTLDGRQYSFSHHVVWAGAPYYRPKIDGDLSEWKDAVPIKFGAAGSETVVRAYWNKKQFCLAVEVEENALQNDDAIQFALAPGKSKTPATPAAKSNRYEFVVTGRDGGTCFQLLTPGGPLKSVSEARDLRALEQQEALVQVKRDGSITRYELALNIRSMRSLRASPGREYCFSLLVHDPDGSGLRDLGSIMNLLRPETTLSWSNWKGATWPEQWPFDGKVEFGFCSSIH